MADALISNYVGGAMWAVSTGIAAYSIKKFQKDLDEKKIPLMGVMGAFVFSAQMINFSIPGTGSSGHLTGGLLLSILLGPYAGFLTMFSILIIQALFFADGGLLALGCNVFNMGFYTSFIAFPLYKKIVERKSSKKRIFGATLVSAIIALQLGSFSVVIETLLSGKTELPFSTFILLMQPIHLAIGLVEGLITTVIILFVLKARPEILEVSVESYNVKSKSMKKLVWGFVILAIITGGIFSWFASVYPDGLEWSILKVTGNEELKIKDNFQKKILEIQNKMAILPDYSFKSADTKNKQTTWPVVDSGTSISGIVGSFITLALAFLIGIIIKAFKQRKVSIKGEHEKYHSE